MLTSEEDILNALKSLLNYELIIYDCLEALKQEEANDFSNVDIYEENFATLELFAAKETIILEKISAFPNELNDILNKLLEYIPMYMIVQNNDKNLLIASEEFQLKVSAVVERMKNLIENRIYEISSNILVPDFFVDDDSYDFDFIPLESDFKSSIMDRINLCRLIYLHNCMLVAPDEVEKMDLLDEEFDLIYRFKFLTDEVIRIRMKRDLLCDLSDEVEAYQAIDAGNLSEEDKKEALEEYIDLKDQMIIEEVELVLDILDDIEYSQFGLGKSDKQEDFGNMEIDVEEDTLFEDQELLKVYDFTFYEKLLNMVSTPCLTSFYIQVKMDYSVDKTDYLEQLLDVLEGILKTREDYVEPVHEIYGIKFGYAVSEEVIDDLFAIIKLSYSILKEHKELCSLHLNGGYDSEQYKLHLTYLQEYLELEKSQLEKLYIDSSIIEVFMDILEHYLDIILNDNLTLDGNAVSSIDYEDKTAIKTRLKNLIPNNDMISTNEHAIYAIELAYSQRVFKEFYNLIKDEVNPELKEQLMREMYKQSFYSPIITMDMVGADFNPDNILVLDDEFNSQLLGVSLISYFYDKDIDLVRKSFDILSQMIDNADDKAKVIFGITFLQVMLKNLSYENIYSLQHKYECLEEENDSLEKKLQLKPLFKRYFYNT